MMLSAAEPGSIFAGKYKIEKMIGTGGMGVILSATHMQLEQRVAIKLLTADGAQDPERVGRFSREAKAAARIQSEHVVRILDYGTHQSGAPFIVMEHLVGMDLADAVKTRGALPMEEAVDFMIQACDGVAEAHLAGIIHRDLKPANLFVTRKKDGTPIVKVLDFGASKLTAECSLATSDMSKTHASSLIGSPRYMAPEQLKSAHEIDSRVDIYALGATLFELLAGEPVFKAESISRLFTKILWDAPPSITQFRDDIPSGLDELLFKCLQKRADDRYQTVKELVQALAAFAPAKSAALVGQIARIGQPPASIAPPVKPVLKRQQSDDDLAAPAVVAVRPAGAPAPAPAPAGAPASSPSAPASVSDGSGSMSTMAVLRAAQIHSRGRRFAMVGAALAGVALLSAVLVLVVRPKVVGQPGASSTTEGNRGAATQPAAVDVPPVPSPRETDVPPENSGKPPSVGATSSSSTPGSAVPGASATARPKSGDHAVGTTHHGTAATTKSIGASTTVTAPTTKPAGDFTEFGNRK